MKSFEQQYPHLASWVQGGWIEIGITDYHASFIRVLDEGGMVWSDEEETYDSIDHALAAAERAVQAWCRIHMPDLIISQHGANSFTMEEGQYLAFIYNYSQILGESPDESDIQRYFQVDAATVHPMIAHLEESGFVSQVPRQARSLRVLVPPQMLPSLE
jgi:DNA-binding MarR family transcriptional regulator